MRLLVKTDEVALEQAIAVAGRVAFLRPLLRGKGED